MKKILSVLCVTVAFTIFFTEMSLAQQGTNSNERSATSVSGPVGSEAEQAPANLSFTSVSPGGISVSCSSTGSCGQSNGTATATVNGSPPFTYSWSNGQTTATATGLPAGMISVVVSDSTGASDSCTATILPTTSPMAACSGFDESCVGASNGSAFIGAVGGSPPFSFMWSNGSTLQNLHNLSAGNVTGTITDSNGCNASCTVIVGSGSGIQSSVTGTDETCPGSNDGSATVMVTGGTGNFSYLWSTGDTVNTIVNLMPDTYMVTVSDTTGCTTQSSFVVNPAAVMQISCMAVNTSSAGSNDGSCSVTVSGGTIPYSYAWSTGHTSNAIHNLSAGYYTVMITDGNGCIDSCTALVQDPIAQLNVICSSSDVLCAGDNNGQASVQVIGGVSPYSYLWSNGSTNATIDSLSAGVYNVDVVDSAGQTGSCSVTISEPQPLTCSISDTVCVVEMNLNNYAHGTIVNNQFAGNGIIVSAINSNSAPDVAIIFDSGTTGSADPDLEVNIGNLLILPNDTTDGNGDGLVDNPDDNRFGGTIILTFINPVDVMSFDFVDQDDIAPSVATAYDSLNNVINTVMIFNMGDGSVQSVSMNSANVSRLEIQLAGSGGVGNFDFSCPVSGTGQGNTFYDLTVSGGTAPYTYLWSNGATTQDITVVTGSGPYTVVVTDANGCTTDCNDTTPGLLTLQCSGTDVQCYGDSDGSASVVVSGGVLPYSYIWSNGSTSASTGSVTAGVYTVMVVDSAGLSGSCTVTISQPDDIVCSISDSICVVTMDLNQCSNVSADLSGDHEVPANLSPATGNVFGTYDTISKMLEIQVVVSGLTTGITVAHIHGAPAGVNGPVIFDLTPPVGPTSTSFSRSFVLSSAQQNELLNGNYYVNIHTGTFPGGEVRGQLYVNDSTACDMHGTMISNQYLGSGITVSAINSNSAPDVVVLFNSGVTGSADPDLEVNIGHLLILPNDTIDANNDGRVDNPDDNRFGGTIILEFDPPVDVISFDFVDQDDIHSSTAIAYDSLNNIITSSTIPNMGNASVQNILMNAQFVSRLEIVLAGSGGVGNFVFECPVQSGTLGNGSLELSVSGGTAPYSFLWSNGETTQNLSGLASGTYTVTITDSLGCESTCSAILGVQPNLTECVLIVDLLDSDSHTGNVTVGVISGAHHPYSFEWSSTPVQYGSTAYNLESGNHIVKITDARGCVIEYSVNMLRTADQNELLDNQLQANIFPNPSAESEFKLTLENLNEGQVRVTVSNILGKQVSNHEFQTELSDFELTIVSDQWKPGVYLVRIENGQRSNTMRWIRQ